MDGWLMGMFDEVAATRIAAFQRAPQLGPSLLFFSGGTALRPLCRQLKRYTCNSIHLITPFDSGGSSAEIRRAFGMLSVGDLRNRLLALADESHQASGALYQLFCHRLSDNTTPAQLQAEFRLLTQGSHPLVAALPKETQRVICGTLDFIAAILPADFRLRGANVGNLLLTGVYLSHDRDIGAALLILGKMLGVQGLVLPSADANAQLAVRLENSALIVGQHFMTGKEAPVIAAPVAEAFLTVNFESRTAVPVAALPQALEQIGNADLICFPYGSFYSSIIANLLPQGIGRALTGVRCPKLYIPNWGSDPEQLGMTLADSVERLIATVRLDDPVAKARDIVQRVLLDTKNLSYSLPLDIERVEQLGVEVRDLPFAEHVGRDVDFEPLAKLLVSLS